MNLDAENFRKSCPDCDTHWKIVGTGEYRTTRVKQGLTLPACAGGPSDDACAGTEEPVTGRMEYSSSGPGLRVVPSNDTAADEHGYFSSVPEIVGPGRYTVTATGRVNWRLPVVHAETASGDRPVEVYTDGAGALLGARLDWVEIPDGGVSIDSTIWGVKAEVTDAPMPIVVLHHGWIHEGNTEFHYTIDPPSYPALETDMVFSEAGHDVLVASALGSGDGTMTLGPGEFFTDSAAAHTARMRLNYGWGWWKGSSLVEMGMEYGERPFTVVGMGIRSAFKMPVDETEMKRMIEPVTGAASSRTLGGTRIKLWTDEDNDVVTDGYEWNASEGHFFGDQYSGTELTDADDRRLRTIWWEPPPKANQDWVVSLSVTVNRIDGGTETLHDQTTFKSRVLEVQTPIMEGDDVAMLQHFMWTIGLSEKNRPGVKGTPVTRDGKFRAETKKAVERLQKRDEIGVDGKVGNGSLGKIVLHWGDYIKAYEKYNNPWLDSHITTNHQEFFLWAEGAEEYLRQEGLYPEDSLPKPAREVITAWVAQEAFFGHWGFSGRDFRVTLSTAAISPATATSPAIWDEVGSIGFSQIWNSYKYGKRPLSDLDNINLYNPLDAVLGVAVFSCRDGRYGGGLFKAFDPNSGATVGVPFYQATETYSSDGVWPRIGDTYTDDSLDLLSKGIMVYNGSYSNTGSEPWPELLKLHPPKNNGTKIDYALRILHGSNGAGFGPRCWEWEDRVITTGTDDSCDSLAGLAGSDVLVPIHSGTQYQVCVQAKDGGNLQTMPAGNDEVKSFSFAYCVSDWMSGVSWSVKRAGSLPEVLP